MKPNYRRCISCRRVALKQEFWQIVRLYPSGKLQLDRGMGRSAYICPQVDCLQAAQKKNRLERSLRTSIPQAVYDTLWQRLNPELAARKTELTTPTLALKPN